MRVSKNDKTLFLLVLTLCGGVLTAEDQLPAKDGEEKSVSPTTQDIALSIKLDHTATETGGQVFKVCVKAGEKNKNLN